jgi:hypothetical protein
MLIPQPGTTDRWRYERKGRGHAGATSPTESHRTEIRRIALGSTGLQPILSQTEPGRTDRRLLLIPRSQVRSLPGHFSRRCASSDVVLR